MGMAGRSINGLTSNDGRLLTSLNECELIANVQAEIVVGSVSSEGSPCTGFCNPNRLSSECLTAPYQCDICGTTFLSPQALCEHDGKMHSESVSFSGRHQCSVSELCFTNKSLLRDQFDVSEIQNQTMPVLTELLCLKCDSSIYSTSQLYRHMRAHGVDRFACSSAVKKIFVCPLCYRKFRAHQLAIDHQRLAHGVHIRKHPRRERRPSPPRIRPQISFTELGMASYLCQKCKRAFDDTNILRIHEKLHEPRLIREFTDSEDHLEKCKNGNEQTFAEDPYNSDDGVPLELDEEDDDIGGNNFHFPIQDHNGVRVQRTANFTVPNLIGHLRKGRRKGQKSNSTNRRYTKFRCAFCGMGYDDESILKNHIVDMHRFSYEGKNDLVLLSSRGTKRRRNDSLSDDLSYTKGSFIERAARKKARDNLESHEVGAEIFICSPKSSVFPTEKPDGLNGLRRSARIASALERSLSRFKNSEMRTNNALNTKECEPLSTNSTRQTLLKDSKTAVNEPFVERPLFSQRMTADENNVDMMNTDNAWDDDNMIVECEVEC